MTIRSGIGDAPKRREDARFLTGRGNYLDDLAFADLAHAAVLRSPHAHAHIDGIDTRRARAMPGVLAVLTAAEAAADGLQPLRPTAEANAQTGEKFAFMPQPLLARDKVRYVGEPVALIVAESRGQALDAAEAVAVDYRPLPAVTTAAAARAAAAPQIAAEVPGNLCFDWHTGDGAAVEAAFAAAAHVVELRLDNHRIVTNPIEPRGVIGLWDRAAARYTAHVSSQSIHVTRDHTARALGVPPCCGAVRRTRCRRRFRRQEFRLSRACAGFVGGPAGRPGGQVDRRPQRGVPLPTIRPATNMPKRRWRSMPRAGFWLSGWSAPPMPGRIWSAPAGCRPFSTRICPAPSIISRRWRCRSPAS